ncbi:unnamed protein product [Albugo candida]|uniref:Uncharacterized protein n=1 Tax=Albugo candida TaxID=65357 RepID=A0A024GG61_9STRA|nr:unnamed protein product [Albugo candida]|eukprot:CCI45694.1 unnamed protein product [Albugo candida]
MNYRSFACVALQVDGEYPYNICGRLEILLLARCLLQAVGNWSQIMKFVRQVTSASWWNARASLAHQRILLAKSACVTLWNEVNAGFSAYKEAEELFQQNRQRSSTLARFYVEWGLAQHFFVKGNRGKKNFALKLLCYLV